jgi:hypothetical protein
MDGYGNALSLSDVKQNSGAAVLAEEVPGRMRGRVGAGMDMRRGMTTSVVSLAELVHLT